MNKLFPMISPSAVFRTHLKTTVIAEFVATQKCHSQKTHWLLWGVPALSLLAIILIVSLPVTFKQPTQVTPVAQLNDEVGTLEQQLASDQDLDAAINFQEI